MRDAILRLTAERAPKTICPSEAARAVAADWRGLMDAAREEATALADEGLVEVTQRGRVVDVRSARGPVRLRRPVP